MKDTLCIMLILVSVKADIAHNVIIVPTNWGIYE